MLRLVAVMTALLLPTLAARAQDAQESPLASRVGDVYEIRRENVWSQSTSNGSSADSRSHNMFVERVIAVHDTGVEVEFDLPEDMSAEDRARTWQFPVRVLRPSHGPLQLLNGPELERRIDGWLEAAQLTRAVCGRWYFTWDAFKIECDPQSVIQMLAAFDLRPGDLRDGASYQEAGGRGPAVLRRETRGSDGAVFVVELEVDPEAARRGRAEADAVAMEILGEDSTLGTTVQARSAERISGTIRITFETDAAGRVTRRTKVTELAIEGPIDGRETQTSTETVERRLVARSEP